MNTINSKECLFLIIDVQEKLVNMLEDKSVGDNAVKLAKAVGILNLPVLVTEQYPKGLGQTLQEIKSAINNGIYIEKTNFSALRENGFDDLLSDKKQIVIFGIETHICVLQTAIDLLNKGYEVFVVSSASGSRKEEDKQAALRRLIHAGVQIVTVEMVLFELLESSKHLNFKEVQALIK